MLLPRRKNVVTRTTQDRLVVHADRRPLWVCSRFVGVYLERLGRVANTSEETLRNDVCLDQALLSLAQTAQGVYHIRWIALLDADSYFPLTASA